MKKSEIKTYAVYVLYFLFIGLLLLNHCAHQLSNSNAEPTVEPSVHITTYLQKEKAEKEEQIRAYELQVKRLEAQNQHLIAQIMPLKARKSGYRQTAGGHKRRLVKLLDSLSRYEPLVTDSVKPLFTHWSALRDSADKSCDSIIHHLENALVKKDSSLFYAGQMQKVYKDLNEGQELRSRILEENLAAALKANRKSERRNRWLKAGLLVSSGAILSVIAIQLKPIP